MNVKIKSFDVSIDVKKKGIEIKWPELIDLMSSKDSLKRALDAIRNPTSN